MEPMSSDLPWYLELVLNVPFFVALAVIALDTMVRGRMQRRVFHATGRDISTLQMRKLSDAYRSAVGDDENFRFHQKAPLLLAACVVLWILANSWRF